MTDFFENILSGVIGGLIVFLSERLWDYNVKKREETKQKIQKEQELVISGDKHLRFVEQKIVYNLLPGTSIEKVKSILGVPDTHYYFPVITDLNNEGVETYIYSYTFINTSVLLTSKDNISLDSITINCSYDPVHPIELVYPFGNTPELILGKAKFSDAMVDDANNYLANITARDAYFGVECYFGRPGRYFYYTYFGNDYEVANAYLEDGDPSTFKEQLIYSYCISNEQGFAPYFGFN